MGKFDVGIIGGGIIGTSAAAYLAEAGASVVLFERAELAAGASGRNSGSIQHPFDAPMASLYRESLALYRDLSAMDVGFELADSPAGLLLVAQDEAAVKVAAHEIRAYSPDLEPSLIAPDELRTLEPMLADGLAACRLATGYPVAPTAATFGFAARAKRAGVTVGLGGNARPMVRDGAVVGVSVGPGAPVDCGQVLVAAGPWSPSLVPRWAAAPPIRPLWGVVVTTTIPQPPTVIVEELGVDRPGGPSDRLFSMVTVGRRTSVGSTFLPAEPDAIMLASEILGRGATFVPALASAAVEGVRACARPASLDGRPFIGRVAGVDGLFVCAGHGPWGISTGPASAKLISGVMLDSVDERAEFSPARVLSVSPG